MSDLLEEAKNEIGRFDVGIGSVSCLVDVIKRLIVKVERLSSDNRKYFEDYKIQNNAIVEQHKVIASLTEPRDDARQGVKIHEQNIMDFGGQISKLEAEVERLNDCLLHETTSLQTAANKHLKDQIESLTRSRDFENTECSRLEDKIKKLEAENEELRTQTGSYLLQLAASQKARKDAEEQIARDPECGDL